MSRPFPGYLAVIIANDSVRDLRDWLDNGGYVHARYFVIRYAGDATVLGEAVIDRAHDCVELLLARGANVDAPTRVPWWLRRTYGLPPVDALPVWDLAHRTERAHLFARHPRTRWRLVRDAVRVRPYVLHWIEEHARTQEEARIARARCGVLDADAV